MTFVDTSAWYSAYVPSDQHNEAMLTEFKNADDLIVTTDYVVDETITLLQVRGERRRAVQFGRDFLVDGCARVEMVSLEDLLNAYDVFVRYSDKEWSFTDCTSYVVMKRLGANRAISLDHHFHQMPGIVVVDLSA